jgi:DNA ligase (NAD+)
MVSKKHLESLKKNPLEFFNSLTDAKKKSLIKDLNAAYYNTSTPLVSDEIYDIINSSVAVGAEPAAGDRKVKLPVYMGSLDKIKSDVRVLDKFKEKCNGNQYCITEKLDGVSALYFNNQLYTRGNGTTGEKVTPLLKYIKGLPDFSVSGLAVRGELIMSKKDYIESDGANKRNIVSGVVNSKTIKKSVATRVIFIAYDLIDIANQTTLENGISTMDKMGFTTPKHKMVSGDKLTFEYLSKLLEKYRSSGEYDVDGLVVRSNSTYTIVKGENPKYAIAFKHLMNAEMAETIVTDVVWKVSKDGLIKPTVTFQSVVIDGVNISQATGFHAKYIRDEGVGPGAIIMVKRAGDVIPHIEKVLKSSPDGGKLPDKYVWRGLTDIAVSDDNNDSGQDLAILVNFFKTLEVKGIGPKMVETISDAGYRTPSAVMKMSEKDFLAIPGFSNKSALYLSMRKTFSAGDCITYMNALNVFGSGIGIRKINAILDDIGGEKNMYKVGYEELLKVKGVSDVTAKKYLDGVKKFKSYKIDCSSTNKVVSSSTSGDVVFSGFRDAALADRLAACGYKEQKSISKKTSYLIVKDADNITTKMQKALDMGVKVLSKEDAERVLCSA